MKQLILRQQVAVPVRSTAPPNLNEEEDDSRDNGHVVDTVRSQNLTVLQVKLD